MRARLILSLLVTLACVAMPVATASAAVPRGFVGMMADGPFFYPGMDENGELNQMVSSGVESIRTVFNWEVMQPCAPGTAVSACGGGSLTEAGGVPTNFATTDQLVAAAAAHGMSVLPVVEYAPRWDSLHPGRSNSPPKTPGPFARFVATLIGRYGPHGSFWAANPSLPKVPIRIWQIWNEPDFTTYWSQQPFEPGYVKLLRATRTATKKADPGSKLMLAGLPNFSWTYLGNLYRSGARPLFDYVAVHPYTAMPAGVITILSKVRAVMNQHGDRGKSIFATELSWPSAKGKAPTTFENATTESGQAQKLSQAIKLLASNRRRLGLGGFYYYTWITNETMPGARVDQFNFSGLLKFFDGVGSVAKPALGAFTRAVLGIEGCRAKVSVATNCSH